MTRGQRTSSSRRDERNALEDAHRHLEDVERWFIKRGLPHFIEDYKATDDVFSRALPLFVLLIIVQMGLELTSKTVTLQHRLVGGGIGLAAVFVLFLVANLFRQPKEWFKWPRKVGVVEIGLLVVLGPAVGFISKASWKAKVGDLVANIGVLGLVYILVAYAILPVLIWAVNHSVKELSNLINLASKALPMLALFGTFIFLNADMWHIASLISRGKLWSAVGFFAAITLLFLMVRLPDEVRRLHGDNDHAAVVEAAVDTPLHNMIGELDEEISPLTTDRRQRVNMLFVLGFTQLIQVLLLSLVVFAFFVALGKMLVTNDQMADWLGAKPCGSGGVVPQQGADPEALKQLCGEEMGKKWDAIVNAGRLFGFPAHIRGTNVIFPDALLQTAILITTFSAFFFAVSAVTDESYRKDFFDSITGKLTKSLTIRCGYVSLYEKASSRARFDRFGYDPRAMEEEHRRTMHVPVMTADPTAPTQAISAFQPGGYQQPAQPQLQPQPQPQYQQPYQPPAGPPQQAPQLPPQPPGYHDPAIDDPFRRWPQQGN